MVRHTHCCCNCYPTIVYMKQLKSGLNQPHSKGQCHHHHTVAFMSLSFLPHVFMCLLGLACIRAWVSPLFRLSFYYVFGDGSSQYNRLGWLVICASPPVPHKSRILFMFHMLPAVKKGWSSSGDGETAVGVLAGVGALSGLARRLVSKALLQMYYINQAVRVV